jgi:hypothetical protein
MIQCRPIGGNGDKRAPQGHQVDLFDMEGLYWVTDIKN